VPRPVQPRRVQSRPEFRGLKPLGIPMADLKVLSLGLDEFEAIRLSDKVGLYQEEAAVRMDVSRSTYARLLTQARRKMAEALIEQKALLVTDGPVFVKAGPRGGCPVHGGPRRRGRACWCYDAKRKAH
jgi:predicted DNA-binding protein (UPF0251 family)